MPEKNPNDVNRQARDAYERGLDALDKNSLDQAIDYFIKAITAEPAFFKARQVLRATQLKKAKGGGAISKLFGSMSGTPALAKAMASLKKEPAKAMEAAERAIASNPYNLQAAKLLSSAAEAMDLPLTAIFAYETVRDNQPDNIDILLQLGRLYQANNRADKAREYYERAIQLAPTNTEAFRGLKDATANAAMKQGKWETADSYRDMIHDVQEARSLEQAGRIYKDEEVVREQMTVVFKKTQEEPDNMGYWKELGKLAVSVNEFDYAIQCFEHAFNMTQGGDMVLERIIGETRVQKLNFNLRIKEDELKAQPENTALRDEIETLKTERDRVTLEECESRARRYPNDLDIKFELAQLYFKSKQIDKAIPEFQQASNNPKNRMACNNWLGKCYRDKGMFDMAIERFKRAVEQMPVMDGLKKETVYNLGQLFEQLNKKSDAIDQYKQIYDADVNYRDIAKKIEEFYRDQSGSAGTPSS